MGTLNSPLNHEFHLFSCFCRDFFLTVSQTLLAVGSLTRRQLAECDREGNRAAKETDIARMQCICNLNSRIHSMTLFSLLPLSNLPAY